MVVRYEIEGRVGVVTLDSPAARQAGVGGGVVFVYPPLRPGALRPDGPGPPRHR
jgi:hypothetical protein